MLLGKRLYKSIVNHCKISLNLLLYRTCYRGQLVRLIFVIMLVHINSEIFPPKLNGVSINVRQGLWLSALFYTKGLRKAARNYIYF